MLTPKSQVAGLSFISVPDLGALWGARGEAGQSAYVGTLGKTFSWDPNATAADDGASTINPVGNAFAGRWVADSGVVLHPASETDYTFKASDSYKKHTFQAASGVNARLPAGLPTDFEVVIFQWGNGQVTPLPNSGVGLANRVGFTKTAGRFSQITILCVGIQDQYIFDGDGV